jgi:gamma-glutamylputrescine oxidase
MNPAPHIAEFAEAAAIAGDCYYEQTVTRGEPLPTFEGDLEVDVGVVGAGFAGLSAALELSQRGYRVAVLEAGRVVSAASGRNGGQVLPGFGGSTDTLVKQLGRNGARQAWDLSIEGMRIVKERAVSLGVDCDYTQGWLLLAARAGHVEELRAWHAELDDDYGYGEHLAWVDKAGLAEWTSSKGYSAALVDHFAGHLNPLKLGLAMAAESRKRGVQLFEHSAVTQIDHGIAPALHTERGRLRCRHIVVASNVFATGRGLPVDRRVMPVGNTIIATEQLAPDLAASLLRHRYAACDTNFLLDYYRVTPDNRMLWGGGSTYLKHDPANRIDALYRKMLQLYPELAGRRIEYAWGGLIDVTMSRSPDFGRVGDKLIYMQGFSGHGVNATAIAGRLAAEAIDGSPARFDLMARLQHRNFPGARWMRRTGLALGTLYYRARDSMA